MNWRKIAGGLGPNEISLVYDQRGHGQSWQPRAGYTPEDYAEDLYLMTEEIGWAPFVLVGHSMGGRNALLFAEKFPEKISHLVIEDIGPEAQVAATSYYERLLRAVPTPFPSKREAKEFFMNEFPRLEWIRGERQTIGLYLYSNLVETPTGEATWRFSPQAILESVAMGRSKDHWKEFESLQVPTLVLRGGESPDLSAETLSEMGRRNPRVQTHTIPNAGHWIHYDQPELFIHSIKSFVDQGRV